MIDYPPGTPCWVELRSPDAAGSDTFYGGLFGWDLERGEGGRGVFRLEGAAVAGLAPAGPEGRPGWLTYVAVDDAGAAVQRVEAAGGTTLVPPESAGTSGTLAIFSDGADGAAFGVWQPDQQRGAQVVNTPGALSMNELDTRDMEGAARFYGAVFGWEVAPIEAGGRVVYGSVTLGGRLVAGMLPMGPQFPPEVPANWVPYFGTADLRASRGRAAELGGRVLMEEMQVPAGRFTVVSDPHGAAFCLFEGTYDPPPGG